MDSMGILIAVIVYGLGCFAAGIWLEWKYGSKLSADNQAIHAKLDAIKDAVKPPAA